MADSDYSRMKTGFNFRPGKNRQRPILSVIKKSKGPSVVYAVKSGDYIKFGRTKRLKHRLKDLQISSPIDLEVIGVITGAHQLERQIHVCLKQYRTRGEWFHYAGDAKGVADFFSDSARHWLLPEFLEKLASQSYCH